MNRATYATLSRCSTNSHITGSPRITRDNILTLRAAQQQEDCVRKTVEGYLQQLRAFFQSLMFTQPEKAQSMCKYYGHVIRGSWSGALPKCDDCKATISHPDQLRKANTAKAY